MPGYSLAVQPQGRMPRSRHSPRYSRLAELLAQARIDAGLTQEQMALRLVRPQSYVSKYENGERRLDVVEFLEVAEKIGADVGMIIQELIVTSA